MSSVGGGGELLGEIQSNIHEVVQERIDDEVSQIQTMDITRAAAALLDVNVKEGTIERLLCKFLMGKSYLAL